jgi:hypothetical protein
VIFASGFSNFDFPMTELEPKLRTKSFALRVWPLIDSLSAKDAPSRIVTRKSKIP